MRKILFLSVLLSAFFAKGQETGYMKGYVVTNANDTIFGQVKNKNLAPYRVLQTIKFKREGSDSIEHYTADQLKSFQTGENLYVSKQLVQADLLLRSNTHKPTMEFWEVMVYGPLSLYEYRVTLPGVGNSIVYQILQRKNENTLFSIYGPHYKERLLAYFANEPDIVEKLEKKAFYYRDNIERFVKEYNVSRFQYKESKSSRKVQVNFYTRNRKNIDSLSLQINDQEEYRFHKKYMMTVYIPENALTKVCFGTKENKECELIYILPFNSDSKFYELKHNGSLGKFGIDEKPKFTAQRDISLTMQANK